MCFVDGTSSLKPYNFVLKFTFVITEIFVTFVMLTQTFMNRRLEQFLSAEGLTQAEFADRIGIAKASVSHVLGGRNKPGYDFLLSILTHFPSLSAEWLIAGKGKMYKTSVLQQENEDSVKNEILTTVTPQEDFEENLFSMAESQNTETKSPAVVPEQTETPLPNTPVPTKLPAPDSNRTISKVIVFYTDNTYAELQ